jgi:hypothetical protein
MLALTAYVRATFATESERGTAEIATQAETNTGTDDARFVTPLKLATRTALETRAGVAEIATQVEVDTGLDDTRIVTALKLKDAETVVGHEGGVKLTTKLVEIGDWNMFTTDSVNVAHGVSDFKTIRAIEVVIKNDNNDVYYKLDSVAGASPPVLQGGVGSWGTTNVTLIRAVGGVFQTTDYNATTYNRGIIYITYTA